VLAVFFGYAALGAGIVLTVLAFRGALGVAAAQPPLACPGSMVRVARGEALAAFCIDASESTAPDLAAAVATCTARGERMPTPAERDAASHGPGGVPPPTLRAPVIAFRCVTPR